MTLVSGLGPRRRYGLICVIAGLIFAVPAAANDTNAAKLCGYSPVQWSANVGLSAKQRRGEPMPFTVPNLVLAISLLGLAERTHDPALRTYAEEVVTRWMGADGSIAVFPPAGFPCDRDDSRRTDLRADARAHRR